MMKKLTIICSSEIARRVERTLSTTGVRGFFHTQGTGTHVKEKSAYSHDMTWPADIYIVPTEEDKARIIIDKLSAYADKCDIEPCLHLIVTPIEEFI